MQSKYARVSHYVHGTLQAAPKNCSSEIAAKFRVKVVKQKETRHTEKR